MSYNCCSGNFSSCSLGGYLRYLRSSCGSSYPSNMVYSTALYSPSTCQLGSSLYGGCQKTCWEPTRYQTSCVVSSPCQTSCYRPRTYTLWRPCQSVYTGSLGCLGYGSRSSCSLGYGSSGFRSLHYGVCSFPTLSSGSRFCRPIYFGFRNLQPFCYRPICGSGF